MHPAKRRRLDAANSTLTKPFRSPLHVESRRRSTPPPEKLIEDEHLHQERTTTPTDSSLIEPVKANFPPLRTQQSSPLRPQTRLQSNTLSSPTRPTRPSRPPQDQVYISLQKQHSALSLQLRHLSQSLDTATQALRYTTSNTNSDLPSLIAKWRNISRDCAEELFITAKDRVNKMGGVGAWREKYETQNKEDSNNNSSWGTQGFDQEIDEDDLTDEQKELLEYMREEAAKEAQKYGLDRPEADGTGEKGFKQDRDDDTYTMDMMLKQLNIDLDLIGYDKTAQRWAD